MKILFLGENWYGSCARACCYALRRLGHNVLDLDSQIYFPQVKSLKNRILLRLWEGELVNEYNNAILEAAKHFQPDILLAFKATYARAKTLQQLKSRDIALYNYYPDTSAFAHGDWLAEALPEYDCIFSTKKYLEQDIRKQLLVKDVVYIPHGYDSEVHCPNESNIYQDNRFTCNVGVIATYTPYKEQIIDELVKVMPSIDLQIWGNQWERCQSDRVKPFIRGPGLLGQLYTLAIRSFQINLAIMSGSVAGASQGDETTTRTYEIPACGAFMLHERSAELLELYEENKEVVCFSNAEELADKIIYYTSRKDERQAIAQAGYSRCVPAYSYENRMSALINWHLLHGVKKLSTQQQKRLFQRVNNVVTR